MEANSDLSKIRIMTESLLHKLFYFLKQFNKDGMNCRHAASEACQPDITVTQCTFPQQRRYSQNGAVVFEYEVEEPRQGLGNWVAQVQSHFLGGEGGVVLLLLTCFPSTSSNVVTSSHFNQKLCDIKKQHQNLLKTRNRETLWMRRRGAAGCLCDKPRLQHDVAP
jgi:hypothetical protein